MLSGTGRLTMKSQLCDYQYRGRALDALNFLDFTVQTYEETKKESTPRNLSQANLVGRPRHDHADYINGHPETDRKTRVLRSAENNILPNFVGQWFPRSDDEDVKDLHAAMMLILLKPWRELDDLCSRLDGWQSELQCFLDNSDTRNRDIVCSIQDYHQCKTAAEQDSTDADDGSTLMAQAQDGMDADTLDVSDDVITHATGGIAEEDITEDDIAAARQSHLSIQESAYASQAVHVAGAASIFHIGHPTMPLSHNHAVSTTDAQYDLTLRGWQEQLQAQSARTVAYTLSSSTTDPGDITLSPESTVLQSSTLDECTVELCGGSDRILAPATLSELLPDQFRAADIITRHLQDTLNGACPTQLLMHIQGEGGTGKSKVIQTVTRVFEEAGVDHWLVKCAYTGIAALIIGGETAHRVAGLSTNGHPLAPATRERMQNYWRHARYLIIDEVSMISRKILADMSSNIGCAKFGETVRAHSYHLKHKLISPLTEFFFRK